jgi:hypothetical protein
MGTVIARLRSLLGEMFMTTEHHPSDVVLSVFAAGAQKRSAMRSPPMSAGARTAALSSMQWSISGALCLTVSPRRHWPADHCPRCWCAFSNGAQPGAHSSIVRD